MARTAAFREAYQRRRCLVPADGFFEWQKDGTTQTSAPGRRQGDQAPFAFAGLWERCPQPGGAVLRSCTIITCPANELVAVHDRMPVILAPEDYARWLDPSQADGRAAQALPGN